MSDRRGALIVPEEFKRHWGQHSFEISGLLCWAKVMGWDVVLINEDLDKYDILMTNVSSTESEYISVVRQANPDATLIACFDYGFDVVNQYFSSLARVREVMERADHLFSVNRNQWAWMRHLFPKRTIHYVPHPSDVQSVAKFRVPPESRRGIGAMWHQYDNYQIQSLIVAQEGERASGLQVPKAAIGIKTTHMLKHGIRIPGAGIAVIGDDCPDPKLRGQPLDPDLPKVVQKVPQGMGWDTVVPYLGVEMWYQMLANFRVCLDLYTVNSIGRFGIDCAALGIPLIASDRQDSSKLLYPLTTVDPFDPDPPIRLLAKVLNDSSFYTRVADIAQRNVDKHFGFAVSKARMMKVLEGER